MKKFYAFAIFTAFVNFSISQNLTGFTTIPFGESLDGYSFTCDQNCVTQTNKSGADQVWDFSAHSVSNGTKSTLQSQDPTSSPYFSQFPEANYLQNVENQQYIFEKIDNTTFTRYGVVTDAGFTTVVLKFSDPYVVMEFPMNYQQMHSDAFSGSSSTFTRTGNLTSVVDGYGQLISPGGTLTLNVVRVYINEISSDYDPVGDVTYNYDWDIYQYIETNSNKIVMQTTFLNTKTYWDEFLLSNTNVTNLSFYNQDLLGVGTDDIQYLSSKEVYPNPVNTSGSLFLEDQTTQFTADLIDAHGNIISVGDVQGSINLVPFNLNPGPHVLRLIEGKNIYTKKIMIN